MGHLIGYARVSTADQDLDVRFLIQNDIHPVRVVVHRDMVSWFDNAASPTYKVFYLLWKVLYGYRKWDFCPFNAYRQNKRCFSRVPCLSKLLC